MKMRAFANSTSHFPMQVLHMLANQVPDMQNAVTFKEK
jgi:hypothetical protein